MRLHFLFLTIILAGAHVEASMCPSGDDPPLEIQTKAGPVLYICGFEDHELSSPSKKRAFTEFSVYFTSSKNIEPKEIFTSDLSDTYWVSVQPETGIDLEELWFFSETPQPALARQIICQKDSCSFSATRCVFKSKPNPYPKAINRFMAEKNSGKFKNDGEELLDQIFAQALSGDKKALDFYAKNLEGLESVMIEAFNANKKKLEEIKSLKCR